MKLFDSHFHFYSTEGTPQEYWERIKIPELAYAMAAGADYQESQLAQKFAQEIDGAWFGCGVHPHNADQYISDISMFNEFRHERKLAAIGEIGLDYYYETSDRKNQQIVMEKFLALALDWELPAIIHCRDLDEREDAYEDTYGRLRDFANAGGEMTVHCFAGTTEWAKKFLDLGAYLGVTGMVTFPKAENIRSAVKYIPNDRILLETDSPYLAPVPYRGKTNHPGYLIKVAEKVAEVKNCAAEEIAEFTTANAARLFKLELP